MQPAAAEDEELGDEALEEIKGHARKVFL